MTPTPRDGLNAQVDRVLRATTAPREDPAFRARVIARIEEPQASWLPALRRLALPLAMAGLVVALWWLGPHVVRDADEAPRQAGTSSPEAVPAGTPQPFQQATTNAGSGDARAGGARETAGLASTVGGRRPGRRVGVSTRRSPWGTGATGTREPDAVAAPVIPTVMVARLEIDAITVERVEVTDRLESASLGHVDIVPITVQPLDPDR